MRHPARVYRTTSDEWCPGWYLSPRHGVPESEQTPMVRVSLHYRLGPECIQPGECRVSVWGADDMGMERDWPIEELEQAREVYHQILEADDCTRDMLRGMGFRMA